MIHPRCGHEVVTLFDGRLLSMGGMRADANGQEIYHCNAELYNWENNAWQEIPSMYLARSCFASCVGPYGRVYAAGGIINSSHSTKEMECYDHRMGKWQKLQPMHLARGYTTGCIGYGNSFYVGGGIDGEYLQAGIERYDFRMDRWEVLTGDEGSRNELLQGFPWLNFAPQNARVDRLEIEEDIEAEILRFGHRMVLL
jgi:hypothetical protein